MYSLRKHVFLNESIAVYCILAGMLILLFYVCYKLGLIRFMSSYKKSIKSLVDTFIFKLVTFVPIIVTFIADLICISFTIFSFNELSDISEYAEYVIKVIFSLMWRLFEIMSFSAAMIAFICSEYVSSSSNESIYGITVFMIIVFCEISVISSQIEIMDMISS